MLASRWRARWVLEGGIRGCFDNVKHEWMLRHIPTDKKLLRQWLKAGFVEKRILFPTEAGTPQGQTLHRHRAVSQADLIRHLNPVVRGWANYHRHIVTKRAYSKVEWILWHSLWRWVKRRHSGKESRWMIQRYWHPLGGKSVFAAYIGKQTSDEKPNWLKLVNPTQISIRRHVKIRCEANPFDPRWRAYMEDRAFFKKFGIHRQEAGIKPSSEPAPFQRGLETGLSRMKGNLQVRF